MVKGKTGRGFGDFMERKEVGADLTVVAEITLLREQVNTEQEDNIGQLKSDMEELKTEIKEIKQRMTGGPIKMPECVICLEELVPPLRIVQCFKGHKLCEPCSEREEVVSCPLNCRTGFMGKDLGMEAFVRQLLGE